MGISMARDLARGVTVNPKSGIQVSELEISPLLGRCWTTNFCRISRSKYVLETGVIAYNMRPILFQ